MNFGNSLIETFGCFGELDVHPHVVEERALLYHALDGGSTEIETLNFVNALVYSWKPKLCIETGVYRGFGSIAIGAALKANGFGKCYSVELDPARITEARGHMEKFDPSLLAESKVEFVESDSLEFLRSFDKGKLDFAFLDSETHLRHQEFAILQERGLLADGAVVMFHDTSPHRMASGTGSDNAALNEALDGVSSRGHIEFPYSRGFRVVVL